MNYENKAGPLIFSCAIIMMMVTVIYFIAGAPPIKEMNEVAKRSLATQQSITVDIRGQPAKAIFKSGEYANEVVVTWKNQSITRKDVNKSKLAGEWAAEKTKEVTKGFFSGLFRKGKHED